jgi:CRP/FNR family transcriptional regulator, cyclic AMP receptor protein
MITAQDLLAAHPFLVGMTPDEFDRLAAFAHRSQFHAGTRIFSEGGKADRFWLIRDGRVTLDAQVPGRGEVVIESLGPGTVLGWSWLFPPYRWHLGATAVEPTLTVELDGAGVRRLSEDDPVLGYELVRRFIQVVVDRLQATRVRLLEQHEAP